MFHDGFPFALPIAATARCPPRKPRPVRGRAGFPSLIVACCWLAFTGCGRHDAPVEANASLPARSLGAFGVLISAEVYTSKSTTALFGGTNCRVTVHVDVTHAGAKVNSVESSISIGRGACGSRDLISFKERVTEARAVPAGKAIPFAFKTPDASGGGMNVFVAASTNPDDEPQVFVCPGGVVGLELRGYTDLLETRVGGNLPKTCDTTYGGSIGSATLRAVLTTIGKQFTEGEDRLGLAPDLLRQPSMVDYAFSTLICGSRTGYGWRNKGKTLEALFETARQSKAGSEVRTLLENELDNSICGANQAFIARMLGETQDPAESDRLASHLSREPFRPRLTALGALTRVDAPRARRIAIELLRKNASNSPLEAIPKGLPVGTTHPRWDASAGLLDGIPSDPDSLPEWHTGLARILVAGDERQAALRLVADAAASKTARRWALVVMLALDEARAEPWLPQLVPDPSEQENYRKASKWLP